MEGATVPDQEQRHAVVKESLVQVSAVKNQWILQDVLVLVKQSV